VSDLFDGSGFNGWVVTLWSWGGFSGGCTSVQYS
jgi:hypothetical protein